MLRDTLFGRIEDRQARTAVQEVRALQRGIKLGHEIGHMTEVMDLPPTAEATATEVAAILAEEEATTRRLEELRERRAALSGNGVR